MESSSLVPVLFREVFSHPFISFFHLIVNGFSVTCIYIFDTASGVIPAELNLIPTQQSNGILNSTITWKQEDQTIANYLITILPPPPYGPNEIMTSTASAKLSLSDSTQYSITISLIICAEWINTTFTFGMICVVYSYIEK